MWVGESPLRGDGNTQLPVEAEWEPVELNLWCHKAVESHSPGYTCPCWCHDSTAIMKVSDECRMAPSSVSSEVPFLVVRFILQGWECFHFMPFPSWVWRLPRFGKICLQWLEWIGLDCDASCRFISLYPKDHWNKSSVIGQLIGP